MALTMRRIAPGPIPDDLPGAALWYSARGWWVVPLRPGGRVPRFSGYLGLRLGPGGVRSHWQRHPDDGVAILLQTSGILVLDLDGEDAVAEAADQGMPDAPMVVSGREGLGLHLYLRRPTDFPPGRSIGRGQSGHIDLLSLGFVVAPPTAHWKTGAGYSWAVQPTGPLPHPPEWVLELGRSAGCPGSEARPARQPGTPPQNTRSERLRRFLVDAILRDEDDATIMAAVLADPDLSTLQDKHRDGLYLQRALRSAHTWVDERFA